MKIYVNTLLLPIGVVLNFCVSSSMPSSSSNQPTSPARNQGTSRPYQAKYKDRPVFDKNTGELIAIFYNRKRINISDMVFEEKNPDLIPDLSWLCRERPRKMNGRYLQHKVYHDYDSHSTGVTIQPQRNDLVMDLSGQRIMGIFRDDGHYYEIVHRKSHAHKWTLP